MFSELQSVDELYGLNMTDPKKREYQDSKDRLRLKKIMTQYYKARIENNKQIYVIHLFDC